MPDDLLQVLTRFHREVVLPDIERVVHDAITPLRDEMLTHFDAVYHRLDRLETEYHMLVAAVARIEKQIAEMQKHDVRRELAEIKARVALLEERIEQLEAEL